MKKWILILLLATNRVVFCQENSDTSKSNNTHGIRISFGLGASPIWNYMKDKKDDFNLSAGLLTSVNFDNFLELRTGLLVDVKKYSVYEYYYTYTSLEEKINEKKFSFQYFRIPALVNINVIKKSQLFLFSSFGIIFGLPLYRNPGFKNFKSVDNYPKNSVDYSARNNYIIHGGLGLKYYYKKNCYIVIEPFINHFLFNIPHKIESRSSPGSVFYSGNYSGPKYIESVSSRNVFGTTISLNYNLFIPAKKL